MNDVHLIIKFYDYAVAFLMKGIWEYEGFETFTFNPFVPNALFLYPLKTSENRFSDDFRGNRS